MKSVEALRNLINQWIDASDDDPEQKVLLEVLHRRLDAIEDEVFTNYMKLPTDSGGKPVRIGDRISIGDDQYFVMALASDGSVVTTQSEALHYVKTSDAKRLEHKHLNACFDVGHTNEHIACFNCSECGCVLIRKHALIKDRVPQMLITTARGNRQRYCPQYERKIVG